MQLIHDINLACASAEGAFGVKHESFILPLFILNFPGFFATSHQSSPLRFCHYWEHGDFSLQSANYGVGLPREVRFVMSLGVEGE